jgi:GNAT superfamily N-acetyltransferase
MEFTVLGLEEAHIDEISEIIKTTITDSFLKEGSTDPDSIASEIQSAINRVKELATNNQNGKVLLTIVDGKVVGIMGVDKPSKGFIEASSSAGLEVDVENTREICLAYILPEYQSSGIGRKLATQLIEYLQSSQYKYYCLYSGYVFSIPAWRKIFGPETKELKSYFPDGSNGYVWLKKIDEL